LRKSHGAARSGRIGFACVFSREPVMQPDALLGSAETAAGEGAANDGSLNCHGYGSVVTVTATFGLCAAGWLLDRLASGGQRLKK
jgi:tRNA A37 threonylcarbamoyladenosine dehydratase